MKKILFAAFAVALMLAGASAAEAHGHKGHHHGHHGHHHHAHMHHTGFHRGHNVLWSHGHSRLKHCVIRHDGNNVMMRTC